MSYIQRALNDLKIILHRVKIERLRRFFFRTNFDKSLRLQIGPISAKGLYYK